MIWTFYGPKKVSNGPKPASHRPEKVLGNVPIYRTSIFAQYSNNIRTFCPRVRLTWQTVRLCDCEISGCAMDVRWWCEKCSKIVRKLCENCSNRERVKMCDDKRVEWQSMLYFMLPWLNLFESVNWFGYALYIALNCSYKNESAS